LILLWFVLSGFAAIAADAAPAIKFTRVPPRNRGGPYSMGVITGRVDGPHQGLQLGLTARAGHNRWDVPTHVHHPFTTIQPDSSWNSATHLGTEYAALLVQPEYVPAPVVDTLPGPGEGIVAVAVTQGTPPVWQKWWFRLLAFGLVALAAFAFFRWRMREIAGQLNLRFNERLAERTRIAQEIHDTLLQGFLSVSMQLHILNDQLAENSPQKEPLEQILKL